jgi:hypothetical protein
MLDIAVPARDVFLFEMTRRIRNLEAADGRRWRVATRRSMSTLDSRVLARGKYATHKKGRQMESPSAGLCVERAP